MKTIKLHINRRTKKRLYDAKSFQHVLWGYIRCQILKNVLKPCGSQREPVRRKSFCSHYLIRGSLSSDTRLQVHTARQDVSTKWRNTETSKIGPASCSAVLPLAHQLGRFKEDTYRGGRHDWVDLFVCFWNTQRWWHIWFDIQFNNDITPLEFRILSSSRFFTVVSSTCVGTVWTVSHTSISHMYIHKYLNTAPSHMLVWGCWMMQWQREWNHSVPVSRPAVCIMDWWRVCYVHWGELCVWRLCCWGMMRGWGCGGPSFWRQFDQLCHIRAAELLVFPLCECCKKFFFICKTKLLDASWDRNLFGMWRKWAAWSHRISVQELCLTNIYCPTSPPLL